MRTTFLHKQRDYEIIQFLGEGVTSCVYKAIKKHRGWGLEHLVAIKVFKSQTQVHTLKQEMASLCNVNSRHCVRFYSWSDGFDGPALVLEYLDGLPLQTLMESKALQETALQEEIIAQVQEGLKDLAESGLSHGDVSPRNIFVTKSGIVKLLDFGLSGSLQGRGATLAYLAVEGWEGEPLSFVSDLFSLGLIQQEMQSEITVKTRDEAFQRARLLVDQNSLLKRSFSERDFLPIKSEKARRSQLARVVQQQQALKEQGNLQQTSLFTTQEATKEAIKDTSTRWRPRIFVFVLAALLFPAHILHPSIIPSVRASQKAEKFFLDVRSRQWSQIMIYQKKQGRWGLVEQQYAPYRKALAHQTYLLLWKTQKKSGRILVQLEKNQRILIP